MDSFGDQLKQERERRNVALDEIARSTKIRLRYLQALENGEHERLPGIVFAKGYVRAFAETIGADANRLVAAYVEEQRALGRLSSEASSEQVLAALASAVERDRGAFARRGKTILLVAAALAIVGLSLWFAFRRGDRAEITTTDTEPAREVESIVPEPARETERVVPEPPVEAPARAVEQSPEIAPDTSLSIPDFGVGATVEQRALVGRASTFAAGSSVVFWTRVLDGEPGRSIRHVWRHEDNVIGSIELSIGAAHWRTYSRQTLRRAGRWSVEARDEQDRLLARETFVATGGGD